MNFRKEPLSAGLYLVSTPIGTARDITLRALDIFANADLLVAEDTRSLKKLLQIHGVPLGDRPVWSYHDHSSEAQRAEILGRIKAGAAVAYASEAGTPLIADPGFALGRDALAEGLPLTSAPGPTAAITALTLSGLPTDRFFFAGFLPASQTARKSALASLRNIPGTLIIYESPRRVHELFGDLCDVLGEMREAALCRELTKAFEEVVRGPLGDMPNLLNGRALKGECVVLVGRAETEEIDEATIVAALKEALGTMRLKDAATAVSGAMGLPRREVYQLALKMEQDE